MKHNDFNYYVQPLAGYDGAAVDVVNLFKGMNPKARFEFVKRNHLCFLCLFVGHGVTVMNAFVVRAICHACAL